jgi:hypothetical protein
MSNAECLKNDEARMSNLQRGCSLGHWSFDILSSFVIRNSSLLCAIAILALVAPGALADTVRTRTVAHRDVRVVGMRDGQLYFRTQAGLERSVPIDEVRGLELDKYPNLGKANEAFSKEDFAGAARLLAPIVDDPRAEDYVKVLAGAQLVAALDRSGKFLDAARRYAGLLQISTSELAKSVKPASLPAESAERNAAAERLTAELRGVTDPLARNYLQETIAALKSDAPAEAAAPAPGQPAAGLLRTNQEVDRDPIDDALAAGRHEQALTLAEEGIKGGGPLGRLLYQRGRALAGLGREEDALLSFMRVVIHYTPRSGPHYGASLVEAGKLFARRKNPTHARQLWTEAKSIYREGDEAKELDRLLAGLPAQ